MISFILLIVCLILLIKFQRLPLFALPGAMDSNSRKVANVAVIGWCFGIVAAIFGLASGFLKKFRSLSILFGIFLAPVWVMFFISSISMGRFTKAASSNLDAFCGDAVEQDGILADYTSHIDGRFSAMADKWMCSRMCPCKAEVVAPWLQLSEAELQKVGRTKDMDDKDNSDGDVLIHSTSVRGNPELDYFPDSFVGCFLDWQEEWEESGAEIGKIPDATWH